MKFVATILVLASANAFAGVGAADPSENEAKCIREIGAGLPFTQPFSDDQVRCVLNQRDRDALLDGFCRKDGGVSQTFGRWRRVWNAAAELVDFLRRNELDDLRLATAAANLDTEMRSIAESDGYARAYHALAAAATACGLPSRLGQPFLPKSSPAPQPRP